MSPRHAVTPSLSPLPHVPGAQTGTSGLQPSCLVRPARARVYSVCPHPPSPTPLSLAGAATLSHLLTFTCDTRKELAAFSDPSKRKSSTRLLTYLHKHRCDVGAPHTMSDSVRDVVEAVTGWLQPAADATAPPVAPASVAPDTVPLADGGTAAAAHTAAPLHCAACDTDVTDWLYFHCASCDDRRLCGCCAVRSCASCGSALRPVFTGAPTAGMLNALRVCASGTLSSVASCVDRGSAPAWRELWYPVLNQSVVGGSVTVAG